MTDPAPYFFFSYARADARDEPSLGQFYSDLLAEVRVLTGRPASTDLGFFDTRNIHIGSAWSDHLVDALSSCRTFLALCSASYFNSEYCGREWAAFSERIRWTEITNGRRYPKLVPLLWTPILNPPAAMAAVQYDHFELGEIYSKRGLRHLLKLKRNADAYQDFLAALAERIVAMAHDDPLPPADVIVPFAEAPDVFGNRASIAELAGGDPAADVAAVETPTRDGTRPDGEPEPGHPVPSVTIGAAPVGARGGRGGGRGGVGESRSVGRSAAGGGPRVVTFVVAATSIDELPDGRRQKVYYGSRFEDWSPYQPHHPRGLCSAVQEVAGQQNMTSTVAQLEPGVGALLDRARGRNEIVVVVVDIWTTTMERFRTPLAEYDRSNEPTTSVLVPWDSADQESNDRREALVRSLHGVLERSILRQDDLVHLEIESFPTFRAALSRVLVKLQAKIIETSEIYRSTTGTPRTPPTIQGPQG